MRKMNLQMFAEAGAPAVTEGAADAGTTGEAGQDAAGTGRGQETDGQVDNAVEGRKTFDELIKGDYKKDFDDRVHRILSRKSEEIRNQRERLDSMGPVMELVANRYNIDVTDVAAMQKALLADNSHLETEAVERGMTVEQLQNLKRIEHENKILRDTVERNRQQTESDRIYNEWMDQAEGLKEVYPDFDFIVEAQNDSFAKLLRNGVDVRTAYEVIHKDDIIQGAMAATAQKVKESVTNDIRANGNRAPENGTQGQAPAGFSVNDIRKMTKAQRKELAKRSARGERITF